MNFEELEKKVNKNGNISYWKDGVMVGKRCCKCGVDREITEFNFKDMKKGTRKGKCRECYKEYRKENEEQIKKRARKYSKENSERLRKQSKKWYDENKDKLKERYREWRETHPDYIKKWREAHPDYDKQYNKEHKEERKKYYEENKEWTKVRDKERNERIKSEAIQNITNMIKELDPLFKKLDLPIYGYIYKIKNISTGRVYIGQTTRALRQRYQGGIIKGWIKERQEKTTQKFIEEIKNEEDFELIETLDVAFCQYHLNRLEAHYIDKYNSFREGYNNNAGIYKHDEGEEEFINILRKNNLEYIDGELRRIV